MNKKNVIFIIVAIIVCVADLWTKEIIFDFLDHHAVNSLNLIPGLNIVKVRNFGISFGLFQLPEFGRIIFPLVSLLICGYLIFLLTKTNSKLISLAYGLIVGGAIGNVIDRIMTHSVRDFVDLYINSYHWPAFNVADACVCIGVFIIILYEIIIDQKLNKVNGA